MASSACPFLARQSPSAKSNAQWWPQLLDLGSLQSPHGGSPMDPDFKYADAFRKLDLRAVVDDLRHLMTDSQDWWPADYGHYGPLFVRMAWHSAGTYRVHDGRGGGGSGLQRFAPLNSWPDNANLDKARRLLWPIKQKYGASLSWADLLILAGTVALDSMGLPTCGFGGGREDTWSPDETYWGPEGTWLGDERYRGRRELDRPLAAVQMGLIYVNPEGPNGNPDPVALGHDIRETFARMSMTDEETVALIAGGHTFGKCHGAVNVTYVGPEPEGAPIEAQGLGWKNTNGAGHGPVTMTSGLEGAWTTNPTKWDNYFFESLFGYEWEVYKSPAGAWQWRPTDGGGRDAVPDAHDRTKRHAPFMLTSDLSLREDPAYRKISRRFLENPSEFAAAFAQAWFKLTHRDMGPRPRYLGPLVPAQEFLWQDPVPAWSGPLVGPAEQAALRAKILASGLSTAQLVRAAWASAATFRGTDRRGGTNGARVRLNPQSGWAVNQPAELADTLRALDGIRQQHDGAGGAKVSLADLIVLAGCAAVEAAAAKAGTSVQVPFIPGRTDASAEQTDAASFAVLEPVADGFRNFPVIDGVAAEGALLERSRLLTLSAPEMAVLVGGMRALGANAGGTPHGVLTTRPGTLSNDFFVNLLDAQTAWQPCAGAPGVYEGRCRKSGERKWTGTRVDLVMGSNSQLRAVAEVYAESGSGPKFVRDFASAWAKVMNLGRYDI